MSVRPEGYLTNTSCLGIDKSMAKRRKNKTKRQHTGRQNTTQKTTVLAMGTRGRTRST